MGIITRQTTAPGVYNKSTPLSNDEIDQNFIYLYNGNLRTINIVEPNPLDKRYGPYETVLEALSEIPLSRRYRGLRVGIIQDENTLIEYWFEHGIEDADLIPCNTTLSVTNLSVVNPISGSITGNSGSSNYLLTPRKISISGDASGYAYFDGSSDISIPIVLTDGLSLQFENIANKPTTISGYGITDAYTKSEVDNLATGISIKESVRVGTTENITLSGTQIIDGVNLVVGDRVLVKNQTNKTQNGIYVVSSSTWTRAIDANENTEVKSGLYCLITSGTTQTNTGWILTTPNPITLDITELTFVQFNGLGQVTAGTGLIKDGTTISLDVSGVTPGTYNNSSTSITPITIDEYGRITTTGSSVTIQPFWSSIQSKPTTLSGYGITDAASLSHNHTIDSLSNVTIVGNTSGEILKWTGTLWTNNTLDEAGIAHSNHNHTSSDITDATNIATPSTIVKRDSSGNFSANIITATLTGNASTASKLTSSRTIELSGDVTGSVSFDGSSNVNIVTSVLDNSHNHLFSNITNTPTTLSGYGITDAQPLDGDLTSIAGITESSGLLRKTAANIWSLDTNIYLTNNQTISISGDATGSGSTSISLTLSNSGVTSGTYNNSSTEITPFSVDSKGRITSTGSSVTITPEWSSIQSKPSTLLGYGITDSYTKTEVDNLLSGLDTKQSVRVATTESITLFGIQTIDGVLLVAGNRVLVKNQDDPRQNGIYDVDSSSWIRSTDADSSSKVTSGLYCFVEEGLTQADSGWVLITNGPIILGSTSLNFTQFNGLGHVVTGQGLEKNGNIISITNSGVVAGTYNNSSTSITPITIDIMGRITTTGNSVTIKPEWSSIQSKPTTLSGYGITDAALSNHIHGNITSDGKLGSISNLPLITSTNGLITVGSFGNQANTFCQGNDSRLSDARIPLAHTHISSDITDASNETVENTIVKRDSSGNFSANIITATLTGNASTASKLASSVTINDTSFDGSSNITTSSWGTSRTITIGSSGKTVNGSSNVSWSLEEIGAAQSSHNHVSSDITDATDASTNNTIVKRDSSGNFAANIITASLFGNASTASKLSNERTISISGDITGSESFDGSKNISITASLSDTTIIPGTYTKTTFDSKGRATSGTYLSPTDIPNLDASKITSGTLDNTRLNIASTTEYGITRLSSSIDSSSVSLAATSSAVKTAYDLANSAIPLSQKGIPLGVATLDTSGFVVSSQLPSYVDDVLEFSNYLNLPEVGSTGKIYVTLDDNKIYRWSGSSYIEISPTAGNADSATKLATARTISLSGDVTGSASFDGSSNVTISVEVLDDSHNHIISNVDGLQSALDGKSDISHNHTLDGLSNTTITSNSSGEILKWNGTAWINNTLSEAGIATSNHIHGNITNDGKIGSSSGLPLITGTSGIIQAGSFGTSSGTFCQGNDSRLSDARTPLSHTHISSDITDATDISTPETIIKRDSLGNFSANIITASLTGNASTASKLASSVTINDTSFDGSSNITTTTWGTSRTLTIGSTGKTVNGSQNVSWSLEEIGASQSSHNHTLDSLSNVTITTNAAGEILKWNGTAWVNNTLEEAGIAASSHSHSTFDNSTALTGATVYSNIAITDGIVTGLTSRALTAADVGASASTHNHTLDSLSNVTITTNSTGEILKWDGTKWINNTLAEAGIAASGHNHDTAYLGINANAASATKLATARTIALTGDVTGSGSFDGSANVSITATVTDDSHNHIISNVDGLQTALDAKVNSSLIGVANGVASLDASGLVPSSQLPSYVDDVLEYANLSGLPTTGESGKIYVTQDNNKIYRWSGTVYIEISPTAGNSDTATKLATARTIALTGDVTGSASFDGSANVSITATVTDDSHNHIISNVDGLQTALDGKSATTHNHTLDSLSNVTITSNSAGEILKWDGTAWVNNTLAEAGIAASGHTHATFDNSTALTGANVYSNVTVTDGIVTGLTSRALTAADVGASPTAGNTSLTTVGTVTTGTWNATNIAVGKGGTGTSTAPVAGGIIYGATTSAYGSTAVGTAGQVLTSNGASAPTWSTLDMSYLPDAAFKKSVKAATTANITLSGAQTIDGISLVAGDRVLVKNQTTTSQNGIYIVNASTWTRAVDADTSSEIGGAVVNVDQGTVNGSKLFTTTFKTTDTIGTTAMLWYAIADSSSKLNVFASTTSSELASIISDETGTGSLVFSTSPTLTTPVLGVATGTSFNGITGLASAAGSALGTAAVGTSTLVARQDHVHTMPALDALSNVTITSNASGEILKWDGTKWVNNTLAEAGIAASNHNHDTVYLGINANATSATKLATARTITLAGDVTGSASFDGSANISIAATVADDSHTHAFANITSKPTTLSGYGITDAASSTHNHTLDSLSNVTITTNAAGEILKWNGTAWVNNTLAEASIASSNHTHGNITTDGKLGSTSGLPIITGTSGLIQTGSFGTTSGTFCQGNDSRLSDARTPLAHTHTLSNITNAGTVAAINTNGSTSNYLRGDGTWVTPPNTTYSAMSVSEGQTGTETLLRTVRADYLKSIIQYFIGNTAPQAHTHNSFSNDLQLNNSALVLAPSSTPKIYTRAIEKTININTAFTIDSWSSSTYRSAVYTIQLTQGTNYQFGELRILHNGTDVFISEYSVLNNSTIGTTPQPTFDASISSGTISITILIDNAASSNVNLIAERKLFVL